MARSQERRPRSKGDAAASATGLGRTLASTATVITETTRRRWGGVAAAATDSGGELSVDRGGKDGGDAPSPLRACRRRQGGGCAAKR